VTAAAAGAADALCPDVAAATGGAPHALELPKASPATTHGVVSELI